MESHQVIYDIIATVEVVLDQMSNMIPTEQKEKLKREIKMLKELLLDKRSPRLMIIGRRGAG